MNANLLADLLSRAEYHVERQQWLHAVQLYERILQERPTRLDLRMRVAGIYSEMGNHRAAESVLVDCLHDFPENPEVFFMLGLNAFNAGDYKESRSYFEKLLPLGIAEVHYNVGVICELEGKPSGAERHYKLALECKETYVTAAIALAEFYLKSAKMTPLREVLAQFEESIGVDWRLTLYKSVSRFAGRAAAEATALLHQALALHPDNPDSLKIAADVLASKRWYDEAELLLRHAATINPASAELMVKLGMNAIMKSDKYKAQEYFSRALELDPGNETALERMQMFE